MDTLSQLDIDVLLTALFRYEKWLDKQRELPNVRRAAISQVRRLAKRLASQSLSMSMEDGQ